MKKVTFLWILALVLILAACAPKIEAVSDLAPICDNFRDLDQWKPNSFRVEAYDEGTNLLRVEVNGAVRDLYIDPEETIYSIAGREQNGEPYLVQGTPDIYFGHEANKETYYLFCSSQELFIVPEYELSFEDLSAWNGENTELVVWPVLNMPYLVENTTTHQVAFAQIVWGKNDYSSQWGYLNPGDGRWGYVYVEGKSIYITQSKPDLAKMASVVEDVNKVLPHDYAGPAEACANVVYFGTVEEFRGVEPGLKEKIIEECGVFGLGYSRW